MNINYQSTDRILDKRIDEKGIIFYKIQWQGYTADKSTWEPVDNLKKIQNLITQFEFQKSELQKKQTKPIFCSRKKKNFNLRVCTDQMKRIVVLIKDRFHKSVSKFENVLSPEIKMKPEILNKIDSKKSAERPFVIRRNTTHEYFEYVPDKKTANLFRFSGSAIIENREKFNELPLYGNYSVGDLPERIVDILLFDDNFYFKIEWKARKNGYRPINSFISNKEMRDIDPEFLIAFYESKIRVIKHF